MVHMKTVATGNIENVLQIQKTRIVFFGGEFTSLQEYP